MISGLTDREILFRFVAGDVLVSVEPGTPEEDVVREVSKFARSVHHDKESWYSAKVRPFDEPLSIESIKGIPFVNDAIPHLIWRDLRTIPGWRVTPVY